MSDKIRAVPPCDYTGSVSDWRCGLRELGWDGKGWHGEMMITEEQWRDLLIKCENEGA